MVAMTAVLATIRSPNSYSSRTRKIRLVVLHTAECPCEPGRAVSVASYLSNPAVGASCHWVVGPDGLVACVPETATAWAAPNANSDGIQIEQTGYAGTDTAGWQSDNARRMLAHTAALLADISDRWGIPLVHLTDAQLAAGQAGVVDHAQVSRALGGGDHWDCGPDYPIDAVLAAARDGVEFGVASVPEQDDEDDMTSEQIKELATAIAEALHPLVNQAVDDVSGANQRRHLELLDKLTPTGAE